MSDEAIIESVLVGMLSQLCGDYHHSGDSGVIVLRGGEERGKDGRMAAGSGAEKRVTSVASSRSSDDLDGIESEGDEDEDEDEEDEEWRRVDEANDVSGESAVGFTVGGESGKESGEMDAQAGEDVENQGVEGRGHTRLGLPERLENLLCDMGHEGTPLDQDRGSSGEEVDRVVEFPLSEETNDEDDGPVLGGQEGCIRPQTRGQKDKPVREDNMYF